MDLSVDVYAVEVTPRQSGLVLELLRVHSLDPLPALKHCRRVRRLNDEVAQVIICPTSLYHLEAVRSLLASSATLATHSIQIVSVPNRPARTADQARQWSRDVWPVTLIPIKEDVLAQERQASWSSERMKWVKRMLRDLLILAHHAKARGDLPVACIATESWNSQRHSSSSSPTVLAESNDTRHSTAKPLSHAVPSLLSYVAGLDLSNNRPALAFDESTYLLTGLTVFLTHEPCLFCAMALLHSRIGTLIWMRESPGSGGCGSVYNLHESKGTNHRFEVWRIKPGGEWKVLRDRVESVEADP